MRLSPEELLAELGWLRRLARGLVGAAAVDEDLVQETWLAAQRVEGGVSRPWLVGTLRRLAARWHRDQSRSRRREAAVARPEGVDAEALVERSELLGLVLAELRSLDDPYRTALLLVYQEGLSVGAAAERLGVPADTLRWQRREGLARLRRRLDGSARLDWHAALLPLSSLPTQVAGKSAAGLGSASWTHLGGTWMSWKVVAAVIVVCLGVWLAPSLSEGRVGGAREDHVAVEGLPPDVLVERLAAGGSGMEQAQSRSLVEALEKPGGGTTTGQIQVVGRLVSEAGLALAGAEILFVAKLKNPSSSGPRVSVRSDSEGRFALLVEPLAPRPGPGGLRRDWGGLRIEPDEFHRRTEQALRAPGEGARLDLGELVIGGAAVVSGWVVDELGEVVEGARVSRRAVAGEGWLDAGRDVNETDDAGHFRLTHVPPGELELEVHGRGFLESTVTLRVRAAEAHDGQRIELRRGPELAGRVLDVGGRPLAGARVSASFDDFEFWPGEPTDVSGRFRVGLCGATSTALVVVLDGYERADEAGWGFAPGTEGIEITMRRLPRARFRVVDGLTSEPLSRVRAAVFWGNGEGTYHRDSRFLELPPDEAGLIGIDCLPGRDQLGIQADGFAWIQVDVEETALDAVGQEVRLMRKGRIQGRVLENGLPAVGALVTVATLRFEWLAPLGGEPEDLRRKTSELLGDVPDFYVSTGLGVGLGIALPDFVWRRSWATPELDRLTDAEGRFSISAGEGPPVGLEVWSVSGKGARSVDFVRVPASTVVEVPAFEVGSPAKVVGRLLLSPSVDATRIKAHLDGWRRSHLGESGEFAFEGLAPGRYALSFDGPGLDSAREPVYVLELEPGESRELKLEAAGVPACHLELEITVNGAAPPSKSRAYLFEAGRGLDSTIDSMWFESSPIDAEGRAAWASFLRGPVEVALTLGPVRLVHPEVELELGPGELSRTGAFETGKLQIEMGAPLAERIASLVSGTLRIVFNASGGGAVGAVVHVNVSSGLLTFNHEPIAGPNGVLQIDLPAGEWDWQLVLTDRSSNQPSLQLTGFGLHVEPEGSGKLLLD